MTERGALLGNRYELDQIIGRGGMAEVWRAKDNRLGREVAVKRLRVDLASDATFQARFRREAQAAAGLNHPNIVSVYDTGEEIDQRSDVHVPYIVMELVEGVTLRDVLRDGRKILPERALEFAQGVLDALDYSHRAGIVHRDIKPANVMLTGAGTVKVMDFGIARAVADTSATMTQTAAVIGTAQYLSPEQARGEKVDNRSDIYSTGVLLYELLVGRPPFVGDSPVSVAYQHVRETPVAPSSIDAEITPAMDAIVLKALSKNPSERYPNAKSMRDDIARCLDNLPLAAAVPSSVQMASATEPVTQVISPTERTATMARRAIVEKPDKRGPSVAAIVVGSLLLALVVAVGIAIYIITRPTTPVAILKEVPNVVGFNVPAARSALTNAGFKVDTKQVNSDTDAKDNVIDQDPKGGAQLEIGKTVTLTVSLGPAERTIPDLKGKTWDEAQETLKSAGFTAAPIRKNADPKNEPNDALANTVISSEPSSGTSVKLDQVVTLTIATGKSIVPNLNGMSLVDATSTAKDAGFSIKEEYVDTNDYPENKVFGQSVAGGAVEPRSTVIKVSVARKVQPTTGPTQPSEQPNPTATPTQGG